jgi:D-amino peptidase
VAELSLNGRVVGETGLNAAIVGAFDVPVLLVTGDRQTTEEARSVLGDIETVAVKDGISQTAAHCLHPETATEKIKAAAERALKLRVKPFKVTLPVKVSLKFKSPLHADMAELIPETKRLDGTTLEWTNEDMVSFYSTFMGLIYLAMLEEFVP